MERTVSPERASLRFPLEQRGQAMLLTVVLLAAGMSAVIYTFASPARQASERDRITAAALAQARAALVGYATGVRLDTGGSPRIGDLPCPDLTNGGTAAGSCSNAGGTTIGRLPWRTLGLPDLRDGSGERLWYAVSENFKNNPAVGVLNSDTLGTITVRGRDGVVVQDGTNPVPYTPSGAVAVIIAPGALLRRNDGVEQNRSTAGENNAVNYLDIGSIGGNEDNANFLDGNANGFINGDVLDGAGNVIVNDRVLALRYEDIVPMMERRAAREAYNCLVSYSTANNGRYPWAATVASGAYTEQLSVRFGRIPDPPMSQTLLGVIPASLNILGIPIGAILTGLCTATPALCMSSSWPAAPACNFASGTWWADWKEQVFYGVSTAHSPNLSISVNLFSPPFVTLIGINAPSACSAMTPCLTVNPPSATANKQVVVIVAGRTLANPPLVFPASPGQQRALAAQRQDASNYLEGANIAAPADNYTAQPRTTTFNDTVVYR